jgi:hypothetical protein
LLLFGVVGPEQTECLKGVFLSSKEAFLLRQGFPLTPFLFCFWVLLLRFFFFFGLLLGPLFIFGFFLLFEFLFG